MSATNSPAQTGAVLKDPGFKDTREEDQRLHDALAHNKKVHNHKGEASEYLSNALKHLQ